MYDVCKSVILSKRFELSDMLRKLDTLWLQGQLTDEQKTELEALTRENADPEMSRNLEAQVASLEARVSRLEAGSQPGSGADDEYPPYNDNIGYRSGDKVTYEGKRYICTLPDHVDVCYWSPHAYPAYWQAA